MHRILIVGGGFGGVTAALHLSRKKLPGIQITLISPRKELEYYGVLYRLIGGKNKSEAILPLKMIFAGRKVTIVQDEIASIDAGKKTAKGKKKAHAYDTLILAPGSVPSYFNIPGMEENSVTMKSAEDALELRETVFKRIAEMQKATDKKRLALGRFIVVGGGPTGLEIAGEFMPLARAEAKKAGLDPALISVELIEAMDRLLPMSEVKTSAKALNRLKKMGVNVRLNTAVASAAKNIVMLKDSTKLEAATIVWTAGVKAHPLPGSIAGITTDKRGRVEVDEQLRAKGQPDIFVLGDCASTPFAGMAQTAVEDGKHAAKAIEAILKKKQLPVYKPLTPAHAIPIGPWWAAVSFKFLRVFGFAGYIMRRAADVHVYMLVIPWRHIPAAYFGRINLDRYR